MINVKFEPQEGEFIEGEWMANHFKGIEGVGGKIFVTNLRVLFKSHAFNLQNHTWDATYPEIQEVKLCNTAGIIPNGLLIATKDGKNERFVTWKRNAINKAIQHNLEI